MEQRFIEADGGGPRRMARAQHALVPVRRLLADLPQPRREHQREIYEMSPAGSPTYDSMDWYDRLRYRLMPYIYTLGADTYFKDGTIMRGLVMDFAGDKRSVGHRRRISVRARVPRRTGDRVQGALPQGLSAGGHAGMISTRAGACAGGQTISAAAPYERMPLFVRAGSIVPTGPAIQHTGEQVDGRR